MTTSAYDPNGNPTSLVDPLGQTTTSSYDRLNRLRASGHGEVVDQGSVDATATRPQVLRLLEGGHAAFEERGRRYGYRVERLPG